MAEDQGATETLANGEDNLPQVAMIAQYVKDLSFENPNAPLIYQAPEQPKIDVQFNIGSTPVGDDVHEVALKIEVTATMGDTTGYATFVGFCRDPVACDHREVNHATSDF